jgi:hypothetical protein
MEPGTATLMLHVPLLFVVFASFTLFATAVAGAADFRPDTDGFVLAMGAAVSSVGGALKRGRGRPRKFAAPSRAVTLTLPESVLEILADVDPDPSRAVVRLANRRKPVNGKLPAELAVFGKRAVITVRRTASLERRVGIDLVPLPDGRALISFDQPKTIPELELMIYDALDDETLAPEDRDVFEAIGAILKEARRSRDVTLLRRSIIVLESAGVRRRR